MEIVVVLKRFLFVMYRSSSVEFCVIFFVLRKLRVLIFFFLNFLAAFLVDKIGITLYCEFGVYGYGTMD